METVRAKPLLVLRWLPASGKMQPKKENPLQLFKAEVEGRFRAEIGSMCDMRLEMTDGYC